MDQPTNVVLSDGIPGADTKALTPLVQGLIAAFDAQ